MLYVESARIVARLLPEKNASQKRTKLMCVSMNVCMCMSTRSKFFFQRACKHKKKLEDCKKTTTQENIEK